MVLNFFFILVNLVLHFVEGQVKDHLYVVANFLRDEIMLVFGVNQNFDRRVAVFKGDGHVDGCDPGEVCQKLFRLLNNVFVHGVIEAAMTACDCDLHFDPLPLKVFRDPCAME
jgi:hypothetical protein